MYIFRKKHYKENVNNEINKYGAETKELLVNTYNASLAVNQKILYDELNSDYERIILDIDFY